MSDEKRCDRCRLHGRLSVLAAVAALVVLVFPGQRARSETRTILASGSFGAAVVGHFLEDPAAGNLVVSPVSVETVIAMLANGAAGHTRQAIDQAASRLGAGPDWHHRRARPSRAIVATAMWKRPSIAFKPHYEKDMQRTFGARVRDFAAVRPEDAINRWVDEATRGRIREIVDGVDPSVRVLLTSAAHFKQAWRTPFWTQVTKPEPFTLRDGSVKTVPMMSMTEKLDYRRTERFAAVSLPYAGGAEVMEFVLPAPGISPKAALDDALRSEAKVQSARVWLQVPRFEFGVDLELDQALIGLGLGSVFDLATADFGAMTQGAERLVVASVRHAAVIRVDETGTEAAAVTTATLGILSGRTIAFELTLNRPFLAILRASAGGAPLFIAYVANP